MDTAATADMSQEEAREAATNALDKMNLSKEVIVFPLPIPDQEQR